MAARNQNPIRALLLRAVLPGCLLLLVGCGTVKVNYIVEPQHDDAGLMKFRLSSSLITLARKEAPAKPPATTPASPDPDTKSAPLSAGYKFGGREPVPLPGGKQPNDYSKDDLEALFTKDEYFKEVDAVVTATTGSEVLAMVVHDPFWQKTTLSYSYQDAKLLLLKNLGTEVTDNTKAIIDAVASIATTAIALGILADVAPAPKPEMLTLPVTIEVPVPVATTKWARLPQHTDWWFRFEQRETKSERKVAKAYGSQDGPTSALGDTIETLEFFKKYSNDFLSSSTNAFPVSSCRSIALHLRYSHGSEPTDDLGTVQFLRTVADPTRVRTIAIPSKGTISLDPVCGAWVDAKPSPDPAWGALEEAAKKAREVKDAIDKQKADEAKKNKNPRGS